MKNYVRYETLINNFSKSCNTEPHTKLNNNNKIVYIIHLPNGKK